MCPLEKGEREMFPGGFRLGPVSFLSESDMGTGGDEVGWSLSQQDPSFAYSLIKQAVIVEWHVCYDPQNQGKRIRRAHNQIHRGSQKLLEKVTFSLWCKGYLGVGEKNKEELQT